MTVYLKKRIIIDEELLRRDEAKHPLKNWFTKNFTLEEKDKIRKLWYAQTKEEKRNILFFDWFIKYFKKGNCHR